VATHLNDIGENAIICTIHILHLRACKTPALRIPFATALNNDFRRLHFNNQLNAKTLIIFTIVHAVIN
jgi:hypothetical protein